jgi:hypothetical protein
MYKTNELFFKFDAPTSGFSKMSTLYYSFVNFSLTPLLYQFFNDFFAYTINYYLSILIGFFSMYLLLKKIKSVPCPLAILVSVCYSLLPVVSTHGIAVSTLPLIINVFFYFMLNKSIGFSWKTLLLLFFPFFSCFTYVGIFILGLWSLGIIILWIKTRRINLNLIIAFVVLCIGTILTDLRLFYVMFILKTPLNRSIFNFFPTDTISQIKTFLQELMNYGANGYYHAPSFQRKIIIPLAFFTSLFCLIALVKKITKPQGKLTARIKTAVIETSQKTKLLFILGIIAFFICCIAALYDSGIINGFIKKYIPLLNGFNWGRVWILNRVLWYIIFALCLQFILEIDIIILKVKTGKVVEKVVMPSIFLQSCVLVLICLQLGYIALGPVYYNDQIKTWFNEIVVKTGLAKKIFPKRNFDSYITYKEFFAKWQFDKIKKDISYSNEPVVAFGYHPSVLMYNGFNCIDGYNNAYPLSYMQRFRTLIAPELEINPWAREYYDTWGGRMYLYNTELSFDPTKNKDVSPVKLNIDMDVFKNNFGGKYILSRAEISNSNDMGLELVNRYYDVESIYTIYLYKNKTY